MISGLKAKLPKELREAMGLTEKEFTNLEVDTLGLATRLADMDRDISVLTKPTECEAAWRPMPNPKGKYFAIVFNVMVPKSGPICLEVERFKPMNKAEYIAYCLAEYGEIPPDLVGINMN